MFEWAQRRRSDGGDRRGEKGRTAHLGDVLGEERVHPPRRVVVVVPDVLGQGSVARRLVIVWLMLVPVRVARLRRDLRTGRRRSEGVSGWRTVRGRREG